MITEQKVQGFKAKQKKNVPPTPQPLQTYITDTFSTMSIDTSKWSILGSVPITNGEAVLQSHTLDVTNSIGALVSVASLPINFSYTRDIHFIGNVGGPSDPAGAAGTLYSSAEYFRKDLINGVYNQVYFFFDFDANHVVYQVRYVLYVVNPTGYAEIMNVPIPLNLFQSLDMDGAGIILRNVSTIMDNGTTSLKVGSTIIADVQDPNPILISSPMQIGGFVVGDTGGEGFSALFSVDNVLVTDIPGIGSTLSLAEALQANPPKGVEVLEINGNDVLARLWKDDTDASINGFKNMEKLHMWQNLNMKEGAAAFTSGNLQGYVQLLKDLNSLS